MSSSSSTTSEEDNNEKHKNKSIVWNYFEKVDRQTVCCKICKQKQSYRGTTGDLLKHLKTNHDIDATIKGQINNPNIAKTAAIMQRIQRNNQENQNRVPNRLRAKTEEESDPYASYSNLENYLNSNEDASSRTAEHTVEEQRIMAEIEYFREKAAYYRMQKNLTALQARKIKYELDQLCTL